jgi:hypothetical protein
MTEKQASQIMEKTVIDGIPHPNILEYMEALNISIDILGTDYTRDQLKNWILINKYPFLMPKYWNPNTMQYEVDKDYKYTFTLLDEMPDGWRKAFGEMMCEEIKQELVRCDYLDEYMIIQIKEKYGCYDGETEVLTKDGWKYFKDLTYSDEIATLNEKDETLEYQKPTDIIAYKYSGKMYHLENRGISLMVTPNHNLYVSKGSYFNGSKNNLKRTYSYELCTPDKYYLKDKRFKKGCNWNGKLKSETFTIKGYTKTRDYCHREYNNSDITINLHSFVKFLGYYIAEGCSSSTDANDNNRGEITIARDRSKYKTDLIDSLIKNIGFTPHDATDYKRNDNGGATRLYSTVLARWLIDNCGHLAWNKKVPDFIKQLPKEYIKEFLEYLYLGDGYKAPTSHILYTTSEQLSNDVQELLLKAGYCFRVTNLGIRNHSKNKWNIYSKHSCYAINWLNKNEIEIDMSKAKKTKSYKEEWIDYSGMVYCVTVPNHIIYIRRNGKGIWCGNSLRWYDNGTPIGCKVLEIIDKYSVLSENICMICGKPDVPITGNAWFYPLCEKCYCTPNDYCKGDMTEEELKEFWDERKKDWEVWNNEDYKMRDKYTIHRWSKDKDDAEEIIYDISETANKIRSKYYNGNV